ncbi:hypothetical protein ScPMuIL_010608 [Solemya velum]
MSQMPPLPERTDSLPGSNRAPPPVPPVPVKRKLHSSKRRSHSENFSPSRDYETLKKMSLRDNSPMHSNTYEFEARGHWKDCFRTLLDFYEKGQLCDIEIKVGEKSVKCHRTVLCCVSDYFRAMFLSDMAESTQKVVTIQDINESALEKLVRFAYTSRIQMTVETVQPLLYAASILQIECVARACCEFMKKHLHPTNCVGVHSFAEQHNRVELMKMADDYMSDKFLDVISNDEFKNVPFSLLEKLLSSADLNVQSEIQVYEAVMKWVQEDVETRKGHLPALMAKVKLPLLSPTYLMENVERNELMKKNLECRDYLDEAKHYQMSQVSLVPEVKATIRTRARKSYAGVLFCVGGRGASGDPFKSIECYDPRRNKWFQVSEMSTRRRHVGVCSAGGLLYSVGGHDGIEHLSSGEVFDPQTSKWRALSPMGTLRRGIALACLGGPIYAIGGLNDSTCFNTVERYDPVADMWTFVACMNIPRGGVGVASLKGHLYAVGGNDGSCSLDKCERYDPFVNKWSMMACMNKRRAGSGVAVLDGYIYVVGGFDDNAPLASSERYDPKTNTWTPVGSMSCCRGGVGVSSLGGKLYAVGGHDGSNYLSSVEAYDPLTDQWESVSGIQQCRAGAGLAYCDCSPRQMRRPVHVKVEHLNCV